MPEEDEPIKLEGPETYVLIDGDILAHRYASSVQITVDFGEGSEPCRSGNEAEAIARIERKIESIANYHDAKIKVALSVKHTFRHDLSSGYYKAGRKPNAVDVDACKTFLVDKYNATIVPRLEADDVLGIWMTNPVFRGTKICASIDKDLMQIPGKHLHLVDHENNWVEQTPDGGFLAHMKQTLEGDPTDNYPGCPGVGEKRIPDIIACDSFVQGDGRLDRAAIWQAVVHTFEDHGCDAEEALLQARLAKILQFENFDYKTKEPRLWNPPD